MIKFIYFLRGFIFSTGILEFLINYEENSAIVGGWIFRIVAGLVGFKLISVDFSFFNMIVFVALLVTHFVGLFVLIIFNFVLSLLLFD